MKMNMFYRLDENREPVPCDLDEWVEYQAAGDHCLMLEGGKNEEDEAVSTVFVGLDNSLGRGTPQMFETMHFPGNEMMRCSTFAEAEIQHQEMVVRFMKDVN